MEVCFAAAANFYGFYIKQPFIFAITLPTKKKRGMLKLRAISRLPYCYKLDQIRFYRSVEAIAAGPVFFVNLELLVVLGDVMAVVTPSRLIVRFLRIISPAIMIYRLGNANPPNKRAGYCRTQSSFTKALVSK